MSAYVAKHLQGRQMDWSAATQDRLSMLTSILGGIKSVKILGLEQAIILLVSNLRTREIARSISLRWIMVAYNASGKMPPIPFNCDTSRLTIGCSQLIH